jgi:aryl-alcohol dehydrogenase-like predicted oxidoreductase
MRAGYDCLQIPLSILDRRPERAVLPAVLEYDVGIIARSVLLKGALTYRYSYLPESMSTLRAAIESVAESISCPIEELPGIAYRYVLSQPDVHSALAGASSVKELEAAVSFAHQEPLPDSLVSLIRETTIASEELLNPGKWPPVNEAAAPATMSQAVV